jgi:conjugal transfer mating pair stabilization protein TraN
MSGDNNWIEWTGNNGHWSSTTYGKCWRNEGEKIRIATINTTNNEDYITLCSSDNLPWIKEVSKTCKVVKAKKLLIKIEGWDAYYGIRFNWYWTVNPTKISITECPSGYTMEDSKCVKNITYSYYEYKCKSNPNEYGEDYKPIDSGLTSCVKTDNDTNNINETTLDDSCNSPTPPPNNCKREKFVCKSAPDRKCVWVDNKWQCSPFPCFGTNGDYAVKFDDTPTGVNDANNNGWESDGSCAGQIYIFNGKDERCRSKDIGGGLTGGGCCSHDKVFLGLVPCKEEEKLLDKNKEGRKCHYIGEYCSKELNLLVTKICIQHKKTYCCFNSKLARIINEQGRSQLKRSWGDAKSPNCRGFKPEDFQKLDFSKMDLSEFYKDVSAKFSDSVQSNINTYIKNSVKKQLDR